MTDQKAEPASGPGLLRAAGVYGIANILQRAVPVVLLPVLTFHLSTADVGMIAVFTALVGVLTPVVGVNVSYAIRRRYFDGGEFRSYVGNCLLILVAASSTCAAVAWLAGASIERMTGLSPTWVVAAVLVAALQEFLMVPLTIWQVEQLPARYGRVQVARSIAVTALTVLFVVVFDLGWEGAVIAMIVTSIAFALTVGISALLPWVELRFKRDDLVHALRFGGALIPHTLGSVGTRSVDRFVIAYYAGAAENGLYWAGYQIGFVISLVADAFNRAWSPWLYARLKANDVAADRSVVRTMYGYFAAIGGFTVLLATTAPFFIPYVLAPEFHAAGRYVLWIAIGFALNGMYLVMAGFIFFAERTATVSSITVGTALLGLVLNLAMVPRYGALGAAQAAALVFLVKFLLTWVAAHRIRSMPWRVVS
jgi:O-antigen/teichoic acid export membrane protein